MLKTKLDNGPETKKLVSKGTLVMKGRVLDMGRQRVYLAVQTV